MATVAARTGTNPLFELEKGKLTEAEFLRSVAEALTEQLGEPVDLHEFGQRYFAHLESNPPMIDYMRDLKRRGYKLAICTNNVREWSERWRSMLPVDEIFDVVVDSGFVGTRKPEPEIYEITLERLDVEAAAAVFIDDIEVNCKAARELGLAAVWFRDNEQAIDAIEACPVGALGSVLDAEPVPAVELEALVRELHAALLREPRQDGVERLLLPHPGLERLLAAEPGRDLQRLAPVLAQRREHVDEELLVRQRVPDLERRMPRRQQRQVVLVEVGDRLGVVRLELGLGDLVDPRAHYLPEDLTTRFAPNRLGDDPDRVLRFDEAQ